MKYYLVLISIILLGWLFLYFGNTIFANIGINIKNPHIESFSNSDITGNSLCSMYSSNPSELNSKCGSLTETNCNSTSCCGWLNGNSCVAGDALGPTFRTKQGKNIDISSYYFMGATF